MMDMLIAMEYAKIKTGHVALLQKLIARTIITVAKATVAANLMKFAALTKSNAKQLVLYVAAMMNKNVMENVLQVLITAVHLTPHGAHTPTNAQNTAVILILPGVQKLQPVKSTVVLIPGHIVQLLEHVSTLFINVAHLLHLIVHTLI